MNRYSELNENARGILMEIGNIGTGNAVTSLSQMLDRLIDMECPDVRIMEFNEVPGMLGGIEEVRVGVLLEITGRYPRNLYVFKQRAFSEGHAGGIAGNGGGGYHLPGSDEYVGSQ